jgi:hypothetical protein
MRTLLNLSGMVGTTDVLQASRSPVELPTQKDAALVVDSNIDVLMGRHHNRNCWRAFLRCCCCDEILVGAV